MPFSRMAAKLGPAERRALREIVERADLIVVEGETFILAPVTPQAIDALAAFEAEIEDAENDLCDEAEEDDDKDSDNAFDIEIDYARNRRAYMEEEPDCPEARQRYVTARRATGFRKERYPGAKPGSFYENWWFDRSHDNTEMGKAALFILKNGGRCPSKGGR